MGPKKEIKKDVVEEPVKEQEPEIPLHELQGYGRFEYLNGVIYQGNWKLFKNIKMKHGQGKLTISNSINNQNGKQYYEGNWEEDKMEGFGTYVYPDGSIYTGQWKDNQHHGKGQYEFANGTIYEGQWKNHRLHGSGFYLDHLGRKWEGEYRNGKFESRNQKQLLKERALQLRKIEIQKQITTTLTNMIEILAKSDKKTLKDNFSPYFSVGDVLKEIAKQPYAKFDERPQEKWSQILNSLKTGSFNILGHPSESLYLSSDRILGQQLQGVGQIVQITAVKQEKIFKIAFGNCEQSRWLVIAASQEEKKK